jgi:Flp pilus assembly protein TadG
MVALNKYSTDPNAHFSFSYGSRRGQALVMATMSLFMLFGIMGLAVDLGWSYYRKQVAQTAADAAALAAAVVAENSSGTNVITCGSNNVLCQAATACTTITGNPRSNIDNGCLYAKANGFTNSGNQTVTMFATAVGTAPNPTQFSVLYQVTATVTETNPQLFSAVNGHAKGQVQAVATAEVVQLPLPYCIYALNQTASQAVMVTGNNSSIVSPDCGIADNSNSASALVVNGGATIQTGFIKIVGGYQINGQSTLSPTPVTGVGSIADPLSSLAAPPTPSKCDATNTSINQPSGGTVTLTPGTYCGGINISGQVNVVFTAGIYYIYGGGINFQSTNSTITNTTTWIGGVMFFNTDGHGIPGLATSNYAPVIVTGQPIVTLNAPTSGTYSGVLFYKDRLVSSVNNTDTIGGNTRPNLSGTLYFPGDNLQFTGQSGLGISTAVNSPAIIADTFTVSGGGFDIQTGNGSVAQFKFAALVQ